jgi:hypothetical protein
MWMWWRQAGDQQATVELHDRVFDDMWGGGESIHVHV